jgi:hypothetical protein
MPLSTSSDCLEVNESLFDTSMTMKTPHFVVEDTASPIVSTILQDTFLVKDCHSLVYVEWGMMMMMMMMMMMISLSLRRHFGEIFVVGESSVQGKVKFLTGPYPVMKLFS